MLNQVQSWTKKGVAAAAVLKMSEMTSDVLEGLQNSTFSVVFISPESLDSAYCIQMAKAQEGLVAVVCDEAHCIVQ